MRVVAVTRETHDSVAIRLSPVSGEVPCFVPGQFLSLVVPIRGVEHRRAYSICSSASDREGLTIGCKRVPGGVVSTYLCERLRAGDLVRVLGPSGSFGVEPRASSERRVVLIAGGSGITPLLSIARTLVEAEPGSAVRLLFANRNPESVMFRGELEQLYARHPTRMHVRHVLEAGASNAPDVGRGRLDRETFSRELPALLGDWSSAEAEWLVCGPTPMMEAVCQVLESAGVAQERVRQERFTAAPRPRAIATNESHHIAIRHGAVHGDIVALPGQTVLEAALASGVRVPFSCTLGGCGSCRIQIVSGEVDQDEPNCLLPRERAERFALACIARPRTALEIVVPAATSPRSLR